MEIVHKVHELQLVCIYAAFCIFFVSCSGGIINAHITDGWASDDIYRVTVSGSARMDAANNFG